METNNPTTAECDAMDDAIALHGAHEYDADIDAVMATVGDDPVWEFHPAGIRVTGRSAVRAAYEVQLRTLIPRISGSGVRSVSHGAGTCTREAVYDVRLPDGTVARGQGVTVFTFAPNGLITSERIYASGALVPLVALCFPASLLATPGFDPLR